MKNILCAYLTIMNLESARVAAALRSGWLNLDWFVQTAIINGSSMARRLPLPTKEARVRTKTYTI